MSIPIVKVPNIHTGDVYYVTTNENKLLAVRIKKSHICISDKSIVCDLEFPKGIVIKFGGVINRCRIRMEHNFDGKERLIMENPISTFYDPVFTAIYKTLDDARRGLIYNDEIDLFSLTCHTSGFTKIDFISYRGCIMTEQWGYQTQTLTPTTSHKEFNYAEFYNDGFRLLKNDLTPEKDCGFKSLEEVVRYLDNKRKNMEVVDFDDEPKKEEEKKTISVEITKNTTALELAEKIIAESKGTWK